MPLKRFFILVLVCVSSLSIAQSEVDSDYTAEGKATFYARKFHGRMTASGEKFNIDDFTAAHRTLPFNSYVNVVNLKNKKNVIVKINDRGPFVKNRIIDLTEAAARRLGGFHAGIIQVKLEVLDLFRLSPELEATFNAAPIVDCLGNIAEPEGVLLSIWTTTDLVHMIYMAGDLYLKEEFNKVYITSVKGSGETKYHLLVGDFDDEKAALSQKENFNSRGFKYVSLFYP